MGPGMSPAMLCEWCARIPFDPVILTRTVENSDYRLEYDLGSGARVEDSPCSFCRLIVDAFFQGRSDMARHLSIKVRWTLGISSGSRWGFTVPRLLRNIHIGFGRTVDDQKLDTIEARRYYTLEPTTGPILDIARVLRWISSCEQRHGPFCGLAAPSVFSNMFRGLHLLRLVDVEAGCLVEKRNFEKYVALSYVWGAVPNFRLTKANRTSLLVPGSLNQISNLLPKTIKDTIALVRRLGCRFLWVDALCLLQNDAEDLDRGVNAMDLIYELAWLAVIAACGHDANARLPGVQNSTRRASRNTVEIKPRVELGVVTGLDTLLKNSVHCSRAWTFQEMALPRRAIYFVGDRVFYRCRKAEHSENFVDILSQNRDIDSTVGSMLPMAILMQYPVLDFSTMLLYYTQRALTNQNDAPRAMAGIIRRFAKSMKCRFLEGLPSAFLDLYISFHAHGSVLHRRPPFPSYSWIGWRGPINIEMDDCSDSQETIEWLKKRTWIVWYKRNPSGVTNLVWDPAAQDPSTYEELKYSGYSHRRPFSESRRISKELKTRRTTPTEDVIFSKAAPAYPLLQFWTLSVSYGITDINAFTAIGYLADLNNAKCGLVWLDSFEETAFFDSKGPFEVILLSESTGELSMLKNSLHYSYPTPDDGWGFYNVLLLEWQDGIAERRGFGYLSQGAIKNCLAPGPVWKEIFLA